METLLNSIIIKDLINSFINKFSTENLRYLLNKKTGLFELIFSKYTFDNQWSDIDNISFSSSHDIKIIKFYYFNNYAFVFCDLITSYNYNNLDCKSESKDTLCFVLSKLSKYEWIIDYIISNEHTPLLYSKLLSNNFSFQELFEKTKESILYYKSLSQNINTFKLNTIPNIPVISRNYKFNFIKSMEYAQQYALNYNPEYQSFDKSGGDCTNFVSQTLHYGGIKTTSTWRPYSNAWLRVRELRDFLIYNNLAKEHKSLNDHMSGAVVQFFHNEKKTWTHSGILTYQQDSNYLYCCHSYDKLNYPLSLSYPSIYPKIRIIVPF